METHLRINAWLRNKTNNKCLNISSDWVTDFIAYHRNHILCRKNFFFLNASFPGIVCFVLWNT